MSSRLDIAVMVTAIAGGALWIEHGHRVVIDAPDAPERMASAASACPENDNVPYSARCLVFLKDPRGWQANAAGRPAPTYLTAPR